MTTSQSKPVRTRFAPSPTGYLHIGGLRTALFAFLFARHNHGKFILRVEDTDRARFVEGAIEKLVAILNEMGLNYDEGVTIQDGKLSESGEYGPYLQSDRKTIYKEYAEQLIASKAAYYCFCDEKRLEELRKEQVALKKPTQYDRKCRFLSQEEIQENLDKGIKPVVRQAIPDEGQTEVNDLVYGKIVYDNKTLDDQVLLKSDGFPTYHLAVVVDDHLMEVSHVIRGDEWIPSTPKHLLLYKAFGWEAPQFAHLPLILNKDRTKLSKRQGDVAVEDFLAKGYLKEALINFVAFLGWNPKTDQEIFSMQQLTEQFDLAKVNKAAAVFDLEKLDWINGLYIRDTKPETLTSMLLPYLIKDSLVSEQGEEKYRTKHDHQVDKKFITEVVKLEQSRLKKLSEIGGRVAYFFDEINYSPMILVWRKSNSTQTRENLSKLRESINSWSESDFGSKEAIETKLKKFIVDTGTDNGSVLWPLRVALSGLEASPNPFEILYVMYLGYGKEIILKRIDQAYAALE